MTLEDFFTLTEMKNGLTNPARIEELMLCMMQKQDCATCTVGDAARQWFTVASTLASTENKECLNHFVYLNGLYFLNQWLLEALKCSQDSSNDEELIYVLLESLEKLPMHKQRFTASGILVSVEKLFGHKVVNIKEKAKTLFQRWSDEKFNNEACTGSSDLGNNSRPSTDAASIEDKCDEEGSCRLELSTSEKLVAKSYRNLQSDTADDALEEPTPYQTIADEEKRALPPSHTLASDRCLERLPIEESSFGGLEMPASVSQKSQVKGDDECSTSAVQNDHFDAEVNTEKCVSYKSGEIENLAVLSSTNPTASSPAKKSIVVSSASCNLEAKEREIVLLRAMENNDRCASLDRRPNYSRTLEEFKYGEHVAKELWDLLSNGRILKREAVESATEAKLCNEPTLKACKNVDAFSCGDPYKLSNATLTENLGKKSDLEPESGEFDALEVARRVAIEVEREVVDYREQSCSSSPEVSSNDIVSTVNPDIAENNQDDHIIEPNGVGSVIGKDVSDTATSLNDFFSKISEMATDSGKKKQSLESPNQTANVHEFNGWSKCDFDLNADICSGDLACSANSIPNDPVTLSAPISVSALKGVPELPITPLHFEGQLGWRGSAATSAFRPASPRKGLDSEKTNIGSKWNGNLIKIDFNVTESVSDAAVVLELCKEIPIPYSIPSMDSSIEVSSGRADRIQLDLNSIEEDEAPSLHSSILMQHHPQMGSCNQSPTCTLSTRQHSVRDFDLNENLYVFDASGSQNGIISKYSSSVKVNGPGITIVSSKMDVERDHTNLAQQAYMGSGLNWNAVMMGRPLIPYAQQVPTPGYGYNGLGMGSSVTFQPALYGTGNVLPILDSRSATLIPQISGSLGVNGAPLSTQPFLMSMTSKPSSSHSVGHSHTGLDMISCMMPMGNGSREVKHLFMPGQSNFLEEKRKTASQQSTLAFPLKRKEPDSGVEPYSFGYNQLASWH